MSPVLGVGGCGASGGAGFSSTSLINSWSSGSVWKEDIRTIFVWPWKMVSVSVRYLFYQPMDEKIKNGLFVFPPKKTPIWRRRCSIGQWCCSMTSKRSIGWFPESSRAWSFPPKRLLNQPKSTCVCICSINQSNRSISVRLLFLFCSCVFISYKNRSINSNDFLFKATCSYILVKWHIL